MTHFSNRNSWGRNMEFGVIMHTFLPLPLKVANVSYLNDQLSCNNIPSQYVALCGFQKPLSSLSINTSLSLSLSLQSLLIFLRQTQQTLLFHLTDDKTKGKRFDKDYKFDSWSSQDLTLPYGSEYYINSNCDSNCNSNNCNSSNSSNSSRNS